MTLLLSHGLMLDAAWDDDELALADLNVTLAELHGEPAFDHEEQLILALVMVPYELALELDELDVGVIDLADDLGAPVP